MHICCNIHIWDFVWIIVCLLCSMRNCLLQNHSYVFCHGIEHTFCKPALKYIGGLAELTHWCRVTHIYITKLVTIGADNGLSPGRRQAIIWTNAGLLLIGPLGTKVSQSLIEIYIFPLTKINLKMPSAIWRPFYRGLNVLTIPAK